MCLVLEYAENGDLLQKMIFHQKNKTNFPEKEIWKILGQMASGLKALHDLKILHRDMKCANVFMCKDGIYKL